MTGFSLVLFFVLWLWTLVRGDTDVSCDFMKSCILPCSFQAGSEEIIHWIQIPGDINVHSFYHSQDQLALQDQRFRKRTSLFKDQISRGNGSLQLTGVQVQDQGRYRCHTSTNRGTRNVFINLKVDAPVSKIHIEQVGNRITCSSEGIYPEPEITWSTNPPSTFKNTTRVQQTEQQLYNISSSLILSDHVPDVDHSCSISTRRNSRRATLRHMSSLSGSSSEISVPCTVSNKSRTGFSLIWRFDRNQIILNWTGHNYTVSEQWRLHVKNLSESGSLILQGLSSHQGRTYTCELSSKEETYVSNTVLKIEEGSHTGFIVGLVVGLILVAVLPPLVVYYTCKKIKVEE
ncbi:hypothetical protein Q8A73_020683 [Channa argus]|nr:hypothetical protein Q8A73_020683 [Channa argus]